MLDRILFIRLPSHTSEIENLRTSIYETNSIIEFHFKSWTG